MKMDINARFIGKWHPKYDEKESDEEEYNAIIDLVCRDIEASRTIKKATFEKIIRWKSPRSKGLIAWDDYGRYRRTIRRSTEISDDEKMKVLVELPGIGAPVAATILHFIYPGVFPIYDFRTVETLRHFGYLGRKTVSVANYHEFRKAISDIQIAVRRYNLRQIDRALFAYHKINTGIFRNGLPNVSRRGSRSSIPSIVRYICEELGKNGKVILRKDIMERTRQLGINAKSVLPADYCDNTRTGRWSRHSFLHSIGPGKYILTK